MTVTPALLHIIGRSEWSEALSLGEEYRAHGQAELGFMHLSTPESVLVPANAFYRGREDLVLLVVDGTCFGDELRWEPGVPPSGRTLFPHLYGALRLDLVLDVIDFPSRADGSFELPAEFVGKPGSGGPV